MVQSSQGFPHIQLRLTIEGRAASPPGRAGKKNQITLVNLNNRQGQQNNHGIIKDVSRSAGTIQKDWAIVNSFELTEAFSIAVVGHEGWNNDPFAEVPYSLVVSFEAIQTDIPIYTPMVEAQIETEIEQPIEIQSL